MNQIERNAFLTSLGITLGVACLIGLSLGLILNSINIGLGVFILSIVIQVGYSYISSERKEDNDLKNLEETLDRYIKDASELKVPVMLGCAYCNIQNKVPISLLNENVFKCVSCNAPNKVYIQYTTVRITQPLANTVPMKEIDIENSLQRQTTINESIKINE